MRFNKSKEIILQLSKVGMAMGTRHPRTRRVNTH
jgi:hypothetical protein